jgi:hypothetical protein
MACCGAWESDDIYSVDLHLVCAGSRSASTTPNIREGIRSACPQPERFDKPSAGGPLLRLDHLQEPGSYPQGTIRAEGVGTLLVPDLVRMVPQRAYEVAAIVTGDRDVAESIRGMAIMAAPDVSAGLLSAAQTRFRVQRPRGSGPSADRPLISGR